MIELLSHFLFIFASFFYSFQFFFSIQHCIENVRLYYNTKDRRDLEKTRWLRRINADYWCYDSKKDIQKYVDFARIVKSIESIKKSIFNFFTIVQLTTFSTNLIENQRRDLIVLRKNHKKNLRMYRDKIEILKILNLFILTSVDRFNLIYLRIQSTIFQKLSTLKKRLASTNWIRELEIIRNYKYLQKVSKYQQLDEWLLNWEKMYAKTKWLNLSNVQKNRCAYNF